MITKQDVHFREKRPLFGITQENITETKQALLLNGVLFFFIGLAGYIEML